MLVDERKSEVPEEGVNMPIDAIVFTICYCGVQGLRKRYPYY